MDDSVSPPAMMSPAARKKKHPSAFTDPSSRQCVSPCDVNGGSTFPAVEMVEGEGDPSANTCKETVDDDGGSTLTVGGTEKVELDDSSSDDSYVSLGYPLDFGPNQEEKLARWENDSVCTFLCDFLCVLPMKSNKTWDEITKQRVSAGLTVCHGGEKDGGELFYDCKPGGTVISETEDTVTIDIRGRYVDDAIALLMRHFLCSPELPGMKYMKVVVGCMEHGVGMGKLKQAVTDFLQTDNSISFSEEFEGSVISIELDPKKDYMPLWTTYCERDGDLND